jgi:hypothetical protein
MVTVLRNTTVFYYVSGLKPVLFACYVGMVHDKKYIFCHTGPVLAEFNPKGLY